jgi:hypothetical protein
MAEPRDDRRKRFLLPREHGAYAELGLPLVTGLALGRPGPASAALAVAALATLLPRSGEYANVP